MRRPVKHTLPGIPADMRSTFQFGPEDKAEEQNTHGTAIKQVNQNNKVAQLTRWAMQCCGWPRMPRMAIGHEAHTRPATQCSYCLQDGMCTL